MIYRSAALALLLSGSIVLITALALLPMDGWNGSSLLAASAVILVVSFIVLFLALEYLLFRDLKHIRELLFRMTLKEDDDGPQPGVLNPLGNLAEDIKAFAGAKQKEIDALRKQEAFRKDFIADVSHELKTPIFAAQGFVHTLLDGAVKDKTVRKKFLKKAAKSLDGLDILVQDLLILSQIETGQIKMRFEHVDLYALAEEVFDQFGKSNKKEISLRIEGPVRKVMAYADRQRMFQVLTNLISNAIKHSDEEGEVVVSFSLRKKSVITRIIDKGEGIPPEHLNRIFERFYRVDKSRSREKGGTGLGLAIVKHILEGHHTKPEVESVPGKGSTFSFRLPRFKAEENGNGQLTDGAKSKGLETKI